MRKFGILALALVSTAAWAAHSPAVSDNASESACFGQARAFFVHLGGGRAWGALASERKGDNAAQNAAYRETCGH